MTIDLQCYNDHSIGKLTSATY